GLSAGRVQSAALRMIVDRERERIAFRRAIYWDLSAELKKGKEPFDARLSVVGGKKIAASRDFDETTGKLPGSKVLVPKDEVDAIVDVVVGTQLQPPSTTPEAQELGFKLQTATQFTSSQMKFPLAVFGAMQAHPHLPPFLVSCFTGLHAGH
ncbi:MAG: hypothetical protein EOP09_11240, partial [Proteobacteria bacterium]